jgi:glycosyltransferase involved in cell wall biosynthesis
MTQPIDVSLVIPVLDEQYSLRELHRRITKVAKANNFNHEILFINDGSTDQTPGILEELAGEDDRVEVIHFRRNFGKSAALDAGFKRARGRVLITMDADLQDEANEIPRLLSKLDEGYDLVSGWKKQRNDPLNKKIPSKLFNFTVSRVSGLKLHDFNCGFKAYRREAVEGLSLYGEMHRFVPVLVHWRGFRVTEVAVDHHMRQHGRSKYGFKRLFKGFFDLLTVVLLTRFVTRPLHLFGGVGMLFGVLGVLILLYLTGLWLAGKGPIGSRPLLFLGLLLVMVGVQFVCTGLVAELIIRSEHEERHSYVIQSCHRSSANAQNK